MTTTFDSKTKARLAALDADRRIRDIAQNTIATTNGRIDYTVADGYPLREKSETGVGLLTTYRPDVENDPVFQAKREVLFTLLEPKIELVRSVLQPRARTFDKAFTEQVELRMMELLEQQVLRPASEGGFDLYAVASGGTSAVGWGRQFLRSTNVAPKAIQRMAKASEWRTRVSDEELEALASPPDEVPMVLVEDAPDLIDGLRKLIDSAVRPYSEQERASFRRWAEACAVSRIFHLPMVARSDVSGKEGQRIIGWLTDDPELALRSLWDTIRQRSGGQSTPTTPAVFGPLWADFTYSDAMALASLDGADRWATTLLVAALTTDHDGGARFQDAENLIFGYK